MERRLFSIVMALALLMRIIGRGNNDKRADGRVVYGGSFKLV